MSSKPASKSDYQNVFERAFDGHMDPGPLIKGIGSEKAARKALGAANKYDASTETKEQIVKKIQRFKHE